MADSRSGGDCVCGRGLDLGCGWNVASFRTLLLAWKEGGGTVPNFGTLEWRGAKKLCTFAES